MAPLPSEANFPADKEAAIGMLLKVPPRGDISGGNIGAMPERVKAPESDKASP
jgi:hypothetical protein